jgi:hypothetical protein
MEQEERTPKNEAQEIARATVMLGGFIVIFISLVLFCAKIANCLYVRLF